MPKKVLIISQNIFPANSPRANRATELAKELGRQDHNVILYAALGRYNYEAFEAETGISVRNIAGLKHITSTSTGNNKKVHHKIGEILFRSLLEYPTIEYLRAIPDLLRKEKDNFDILITIGMPHPIHWGTARYIKSLKGSKKFTWIADCGDPYMGNPFRKKMFYFKYLEESFCEHADYITVPVESAIEAYYPQFRDKIKVIPQGFQISKNKEIDEPENDVPTFMYAGVFYKDKRDPRALLNYLVDIKKDFKFIVHTRSQAILEPYKQKLGKKLVVEDYLPRTELLSKMQTMDFLINVANISNVQSPSKLIDYAISGRPVYETKSGEIDKTILDEFLEGNYEHSLKLPDLEQFNIKNIARKFIELSNEY